MANLKSSKKRAKQMAGRQFKNSARKTGIKTAMSKVLASIEAKQDIATTKELLRDAEAKLARAKNKNVLHQNTVARKISLIAKRVAAAERSSK
jgi:small subunit ribosomal protein S20